MVDFASSNTNLMQSVNFEILSNLNFLCYSSNSICSRHQCQEEIVVAMWRSVYGDYAENPLVREGLASCFAIY